MLNTQTTLFYNNTLTETQLFFKVLPLKHTLQRIQQISIKYLMQRQGTQVGIVSNSGPAQHFEVARSFPAEIGVFTFCVVNGFNF